MNMQERVQNFLKQRDHEITCTSTCLTAIVPFPLDYNTIVSQTNASDIKYVAFIACYELARQEHTLGVALPIAENESLSHFIYKLRPLIKNPPFGEKFLGILFEAQPRNVRHAMAISAIHWKNHTATVVDTRISGDRPIISRLPFSTLDRIIHQKPTATPAFAVFQLNTEAYRGTPGYEELMVNRNRIQEQGVVLRDIMRGTNTHAFENNLWTIEGYHSKRAWRNDKRMHETPMQNLL